MKKYHLKSVAYILMAGLFAGCSQTADLQASRASAKLTAGTANLAQFSDIPIPANASMNVGRSLILGARDGWIGRLVYTTSHNPQQAFEFYSREMPAFGWQEITRIRSQVNVLSYTRGDRAATIQISSTTLGGTEVDFTISPLARGNTQGGPQGGTLGGAPPR
jgi:hypothetical protein